MLPGGASFATTVKRREWRAVSGPWTTGAGDRSQAVVAMPQSSQKNIQKKTQRNHHIKLVSVLMYYSHSIAVS